MLFFYFWGLLGFFRFFISRCYPNKVRDLFRRFQHNTFDENNLSFFAPFHTGTLRKTLHYLDTHSTSELITAMDTAMDAATSTPAAPAASPAATSVAVASAAGAEALAVAF